MSNKQLVPIPPGYCFIPSCQSTTSTSSSSSRSRTTSTTTIFGPTVTAPVPNEKRSLDTVIAKLGTETFNNFPTDAPVVVGEGPVCIVFCEWAERQQNSDEDDSSELESVTDLTPPIRPTAGDTMAMRVTITSIISSTTIHLPGPAPTKPYASTPLPTQTLGYISTPTATPSSHAQKFSSAEIAGIVVSALAGLALVLAVAWLITRKVRQVKARLNIRMRGVHRDLEREIYAMENGIGVPEMGKHVTGEEGIKKR
ncbi:MAG: hypothetical protein Q9183_004509 [Haloplaca sp. 2 TL-2023]